MDCRIDYFRFAEITASIRVSPSTGQRNIPNIESRVGSVDNCIFIHAIVPRHVETVVLLTHY